MTSSTSRYAYALTRCAAEPLEGLQQHDNDRQTKTKSVQEELTRIYQSYAEMYPNPLLIRERLERDRLLQEIRQEIREERLRDEQSKPVEEKKSRRSILSYIFGSSKSSKPDLAVTDNDDLLEEDYLLYYNDENGDLQGNDSLCGTQSVLDTTCIPPEAHAVARFHMSSPIVPIVVRRDPEYPILLVTALGATAELVNGVWIVRYTSDRQHWEQQLGNHPDEFRKTRATCVGADCLAVAWGGVHDVILYRQGPTGWDAVAHFPPTPAVIDNLQTQSHVYENHDALRVTDVATLMVETVDGGIAASLVVSRLGGYMELVPLAEQLWQITDPKKKKRAAVLYHITPDNCNIAPLTMSEHLDDLLHLEVHRTDVSVDTEWDADCENPPAEYLMVASGSKAGEEKLTFWAVATVFSENPSEPYALHVMFLGEFGIEGIGRATIFANQEIMEHWRRPRRVVRKQQTDHLETLSSSPQHGTLSVAAPVVSMHFKRVENRLLLSVLDWNGGVLVLDCTMALKRASQTIPREELSASVGDVVLTATSHAEIKRYVSSHRVIDAGWSKRGDLVLTTHTNKLGVVSMNSSRSLASPLLALPAWMTGNGKLVGSCERLTLLLPRKSGLLAVLIQPSNPTELATTSHKRLWEQNRQEDSLALVADDVYVIEQIVALFRGQLDIKSLDMASCRKSCDIALERLATIRVASALQLSENTETLKSCLTSWSVRAGTYSLLCQHLGAHEDVSAFLGRFLNKPLFDLAAELATRGDLEGLSILATRHTEELSSSSVHLLEMVPLTIDPSRICDLFACKVATDDATWAACRSKQMQEVLGVRPSDDNGILLYCASLLDIEKGGAGDEAVNHIRESMGALVAISKASRSSLPKSVRMIKNRISLMELFLASIEHVGVWARKFRLRASDARVLLDKLWKMYECLPEFMAPHEHDDEDVVQITSRVDSAFRRLVAADILINWSPHSALSSLSNPDVCGSDIASNLCNSFCKDISSRHTFESKLRLLRNLACDLVHLRTDACQSSLDLETPVHEILLMELLQLGEFHLFSEVFSTELGGVANWERMQPAVLNFVTEIMIGDSTSRFSVDTDRVQLAIQCQDVLASRFPRLQDAFSGMRRHLNAAHFINSVLSPDARHIIPSELRGMLPFDVVEHVLCENPLCILKGSKGWDEHEIGRIRNRELMSSFLSQRDPNTSITLPSLPGDHVLHLASIVGLDSRLSRFVVRSRVAHFAQQLSMYWVTPALAIAMLIESEASLEENEITMAAIAQAVSVETDDGDVVVNAVLCRKALGLSPVRKSASLDAVISAFGRIEHKVSRFCPSSWEFAPSLSSQNRKDNQENSDFLVFRAVGLLANTAMTMVHDPGAPTIPRTVLDRVLAPRVIDRVFKETLSAYSADLNNLFQILRGKASQGASDDPLLIAIGRFIMFWCISNAVRIIEHTSQGTFEQADAVENLTLATSVLLHSCDKDAVLSNILEMKSIAEEQAQGAIERVSAFPRPNDVRPDLAIVRKLMELGYTENGARRAAASTNNESQQAAMVWAVTHSLEPNFNAPMVLVRRQSPHVDQKTIVDIKQCIDAIGMHFDGSGRPTFVPTRAPVKVNSSIPSHTMVQGSGKTSGAPSDTFSHTRTAKKAPVDDRANTVAEVRIRESSIRKSTMPAKGVPLRESRSAPITANVSLTPPPIASGSSNAKAAQPPPRPLPESVVRKGDAHAPSLRTGHPSPPDELPPTAQIAKAGAPTSSFHNAPRPPPPPPPKSLSSLALDMEKPPPPNAHISLSGDTSVAAVSHRLPLPDPPPAPRSAPPLLHLDRSNLRRTGEAIRQSSRGISGRLDDDERRRLLNKGRELFQQVRSSPTASQISPAGASLSFASQPPTQMAAKALPTPKPVVPAEPPKSSLLLPDVDDDVELDDGADGWDFEDF